MALIANVDQYEDTKVAIEMVKEILAYRNGLMTSMDPSSTDPPLDPGECNIEKNINIHQVLIASGI
uniref:Uncharacterized protein n=1 Tax=Rhizophagus irregularis (strain DAOM 181602 / DAOM 197198 / MUCL 43194) TaxID=747089 RepID=U9U8J1_RHIID